MRITSCHIFYSSQYLTHSLCSLVLQLSPSICGQDVQSRVSDVVLGKEKPVEETTPEYEKMKHYIFELEDHLAEAQKHAFRLVKRHRGEGKGCKIL